MISHGIMFNLVSAKVCSTVIFETSSLITKILVVDS